MPYKTQDGFLLRLDNRNVWTDGDLEFTNRGGNPVDVQGNILPGQHLTLQYLVFYGDHYYPSGGWEDLADSFDDPNEAIATAKGMLKGGGSCVWAHVVDKNTGQVLFKR